MRLDTYLASNYPQHSRSLWQKFCKKGYVRLNNHVVTDSNTKVKESDRVNISLPQAQEQRQDVPILYQDDNVIVYNKPAGMLTHAKGPDIDEATIASTAKPHTHYKTDTNRPGIVHRLDRATSGVILVVKNDVAARFVQKQFAERKVKKTYRALLSSLPKQLEATIDVPIERNPKKPSTFRAGAGGKPAQTGYKVSVAHAGTSLVTLKPRTGRTHQLRVHMSYIGSPIVGDTVYGGASAPRTMLHAEVLELTLPGGKRMVFRAPLPPELKKI